MKKATVAAASNRAGRGDKSRTKVPLQSATGAAIVPRFTGEAPKLVKLIPSEVAPERAAAEAGAGEAGNGPAGLRRCNRRARMGKEIVPREKGFGRMKAPRRPSASAKRLRAHAERLLVKTPRELALMPGGDVQKLVHELQIHQVELEMQNDELRRMQLHLEEARDRYADLYDFAPSAYLTLGADGEILEANLSAGKLLGMERGRLIHQKFTRFVPPEAQDAFYLLRRRVFSTDARQSVELDLVDTASKRLAVQLEAVRDATCSRNRFRVGCTDITPRRQATEQLRRSEERCRTLIEQAPDGLLVAEAHAGRFRLVDVNSAACRMLGYSREEVLNLSIIDLVAAEEVPRVAPEAAKLRSGETVCGEWRLRRKDGSLFPGEVRARQLPDGRLQGFVRDLTERKRAEERIAQLNRVLAVNAGVDRAIVHTSDRQKLLDDICRVAVREGGFRLAWIGMVAPDGSVQMVASAGATGYLRGIRVVTQDVPEGRGPVGAALRENRPVVIEDIDRDARMAPWRERARRFGLRYVAAFPIRISGKVVGAFQVYAPCAGFFDDSELNLLSQVSHDISFALTAISELTARKQAQESLRRSEQNLTEFFNHAPIGLEWLSAGGNILRANQAQLDLLGYRPEEYLGHFFGEFCTDPAGTQQLLERLAANRPVRNLRLPRQRKDGAVRVMLVDAQPIWHEGRFLYSSVFSRDITDRINLEREILEISEREHRRIAHDLHDGLGQILVATAFLGATLRQDLASKSLPEVRQADRLLRALDEAIGQTRSLARGLHPVRPLCNGLMLALKALAARTRTLFHIRCRFTCRQPVFIDDNTVATHLYRIVQEAVTNAVKHGKPDRIEISLTQTPGRIAVAVNDNGVGLPTRRPKQPGMGLRIMRYRAGTIGGSLAIQKAPGGGTTVVCTVHEPAEGSRQDGDRPTKSEE